MKRGMIAAFVWLFAASSWAQGQSTPKYPAKIPQSIVTPNDVVDAYLYGFPLRNHGHDP